MSRFPLACLLSDAITSIQQSESQNIEHCVNSLLVLHFRSDEYQIIMPPASDMLQYDPDRP